MKISIGYGYSPEMEIAMTQEAGLTLCPRCAKNFTDGSFCAPCEEIVAVTAQRINVGILESHQRSRRWKLYGVLLQGSFWFAVGAAIAYRFWAH